MLKYILRLWVCHSTSIHLPPLLSCCTVVLCAGWRINSWSRQEHRATQCKLLMAEQCVDELWWLLILAAGSKMMEAIGVAHQRLWITVLYHFTMKSSPYVGPKALLKPACRDLYWQNQCHLFLITLNIFHFYTYWVSITDTLWVLDSSRSYGQEIPVLFGHTHTHTHTVEKLNSLANLQVTTQISQLTL